MGFDAPFRGSIQRIEDQWIDYNGHFNMAYYNVLFDRASDEALDAMGCGPGYIKETGSSIFTLEAHVTYVHELHAGDRVRVTVQVLDYDAKRIHYVEEMFQEGEGWLACVCEVIVMHIDMGQKKSSPFPLHILEEIKAMHAAHKSLPVPPQVGHRIGIPKKTPV